MDITPRTRRLGGVAAALLAIATLAGCVIPAPGPATPQTSGPASAQPSTPSTPVPPSPSSSSTPVGDLEFTTEDNPENVWTFELTGATVLAEDATGQTANAGNRLVQLSLDGDMLGGSDDPDFYYQFRVGAYDEATGDVYGLSNGSTLLADNDLFFAGDDASFRGAQGIYELPESLPIDTWYVLHHATGEEWIVQLDVQ